MNVRQLSRVLSAQWRLILVSAVLTLIVAEAWALLAHKSYKATAEVIANVRAPETVGTTAPATAADQLAPDYLSTQIDVIHSDRVAMLATQRLGIANNPAIATQLGWTPADGPINQFIADTLNYYVVVKNSSVLSRVIEISYWAPSADFSAAVANAFAQSYIDSSLDLQAQPARESAAWYERRSKELEQQLADAQGKLTAKERELGITSSLGTPDAEDARLQALSGQLAAVQAQDALVSAKSGAGALPDALANPVVQTLQGELAKLEAQRQQLATTAGPNNPDYKQVVAQIAATQAQLGRQQALVRQSATAAASQAGSSVSQLNAQLVAQKQRVIDSRARTDEVSVLRQDVRNLQAVYDQMAARRSQLDLLGESTQSNVAILSPAVSPARPVWPRPLLMGAAGIVLGVLIGISIAVARELLDQRVRSVEDFELWLGIPNFGSIRIGRATPLLPSGITRLLPYYGREQHGDA